MSESEELTLNSWQARWDETSKIYHLLLDTPDEGNRITLAVFEELSELLKEIKNNPEARGLILDSAKETVFSLGADLNGLSGVKITEVANFVEKGQAVLHELEGLALPTIALLRGDALGSGLELALACETRLSSSQSNVEHGFSEIGQGLVPPLGATIRLPHLIGLAPATRLLLSGECLNSRQAYDWGLVDGLFPPDRLVREAARMIRLLEEGKEFHREGRVELSRSDYLIEKLGPLRRWWKTRLLKESSGPEGEEEGKSPLSSLRLVESIMEGWDQDDGTALREAREAFLELLQNPRTANRIHLSALAQRQRPHRFTKEKADLFKRIAVANGGERGGVLSALFAERNSIVNFREKEEKTLLQGLRACREFLSREAEEGVITPRRAEFALSRVRGGLDYNGCALARLLVEAGEDEFESKQDELLGLEAVAGSEAPLVAVTSRLSVSALARGLKRPERLVGLRFFEPLSERQVVLVVPAEKSDEQNVAAIEELIRWLGKIPLIIKDSPGLLVDRLMAAMLNEAVILLEEGLSVSEIDGAMETYGMEQGPLALADETGLDYLLSLIEERAGRAAGESSYEGGPAPYLTLLVRDGKTGQKSGEGFYNYRQKKGRTKTSPNDRFFQKLEKSENVQRIFEEGEEFAEKNREKNVQVAKEREITDRLFLVLLNEACALLEEQVVAHPKDIDLALVLGIGFAPDRGGLLRDADQRGLGGVVDLFRVYEKRVGSRLAPHPMLAEMVRHNAGFYI